jgi:L-alanine-DL-glutamate epimerase-like enolase superfamily enzyme
MKMGAVAAALGLTPATRQEASDRLHHELETRRSAPVLRADLVDAPVTIDAVELLENAGTYLVRVRSREGAVGLAVSHAEAMRSTWPIFLRRVAPFFAGKDARDLETLLAGVYLQSSNYKWQGLPFWVPVASLEIAILDLLGRVAGRPIGELLGGVVRRRVHVYRASSQRGNAPEAEVEHLQKLVQETGARAIKFRLGARMRYDEASTRRDLDLIPLTRMAFGDDMTIYADANGSYDVPMALRIGRLMEEHRLAFLEEPVPFDFYDETTEIAAALRIPIAGGEQESSLRQFQWMVGHRSVDVVQPDLFYFGGFIRSIRVARMAAAAGLPCTPHMSGGGLGYLYVAHFASCVSNPGPFQEFKGTDEALPVTSETSSLSSENGTLTVPTGPGLGITIDPEFVGRARPLML